MPEAPRLCSGNCTPPLNSGDLVHYFLLLELMFFFWIGVFYFRSECFFYGLSVMFFAGIWKNINCFGLMFFAPDALAPFEICDQNGKNINFWRMRKTSIPQKKYQSAGKKISTFWKKNINCFEKKYQLFGFGRRLLRCLKRRGCVRATAAGSSWAGVRKKHQLC